MFNVSAVSIDREAASVRDRFLGVRVSCTAKLRPYGYPKRWAHLGNTSSLQAREATTPAGCIAASDWGVVDAGLGGAAPWG